MKVFLITALTLAILTPAVSISSTTPQSSIRAMSGQFTNEQGETYRRNFCTSFAVKTKLGIKWIAADHCVEGLKEDADLQLGKYSATVISRHTEVDIVIMSGDSTVPGFTIAENQPMVGEKVITIGHPWGWELAPRREGIFSLMFDVTKNGRPHAINQLPAAPGDSGSPVFNSKMQVVGVMQIVFCGGFWEGFCPMSGSSSLADLQYVISTLR